MNTSFLRKPSFQIGVAVVLSASASGFGGYKFAQHKLREHYADIAEREIREARDRYSRLVKPETPEELVARTQGITLEELQEKKNQGLVDPVTENGLDALKSYQGDPEANRRTLGLPISKAEAPAATEEELMVEVETKVTEEGTVTTTKVGGEVVEVDAPVDAETIRKVFPEKAGANIFDGGEIPEGDGWDYATEVLRRSKDRPYIISHEEYYNNENSWEQADLTYYEGDDVLCDLQDMPVADPDRIVGEDNLVKFGHGSKDENVVFVRNEQIECEFEITKSVGSYTQEVAGFDTETRGELRHSHTPRKFRLQDD